MSAAANDGYKAHTVSLAGLVPVEAFELAQASDVIANINFFM